MPEFSDFSGTRRAGPCDASQCLKSGMVQWVVLKEPSISQPIQARTMFNVVQTEAVGHRL
jgi:hypothetical protein